MKDLAISVLAAFLLFGLPALAVIWIIDSFYLTA
jgi:hypothetical protein